MPHFSECCGRDEYICQKCANIWCSSCHRPTWMKLERGISGNVCPNCVGILEPASLFQHCKEESGLTDTRAINEYMNRYYGHN
jgi:hypothetical protein